MQDVCIVLFWTDNLPACAKILHYKALVTQEQILQRMCYRNSMWKTLDKNLWQRIRKWADSILTRVSIDTKASWNDSLPPMHTAAEIIIRMNVRNAGSLIGSCIALSGAHMQLRRVNLMNDIIILLRWNARWQRVSLDLSPGFCSKITALLQLCFVQSHHWAS